MDHMRSKRARRAKPRTPRVEYEVHRNDGQPGEIMDCYARKRDAQAAIRSGRFGAKPTVYAFHKIGLRAFMKGPER